MRLSNIKLKSKMLLGFLFPMILMLGLIIFALSNINSLVNNVDHFSKSAKDVHYAHIVIEKAQDLDRLLSVSESSQRAYLITAQDVFLDEYNSNSSEFIKKLTEIRESVTPEQQKILTDVEAYFNDWHNSSAKVEIEARKAVILNEEKNRLREEEFKANAENIKVQDLIDTAMLAKFQDLFTKTTGLANLVIDPEGKPVEGQSFDGFTSFCFGPKGTSIRTSEEGAARCQRNDVAGGARAAETGKPAVYDCHAGLIDFGVPIMLEGKQIGSWLGGQVLTSKPDLKKFEDYAKELGDVDPKALVEAIKKVPVLPRERIDAAADLLWLFAATAAKMGNEKQILNFRNIAIESDRSLRNHVVALIAAGTGRKLLGKARAELESFISIQESILEYNLQEMEKNRIKSNNLGHYSLLSLLAGTIAALIIGIIFVLYISSRIVNPIRAAAHMASSISNEDYSEKLNITTNDETGMLANALNNMSDMISSNREAVLQNLQTMKMIVDSVTIVSNEVTTGAGQVANASDILSQGSTKSASSIEEISAIVLEIESQTSKNATDAREADVLSLEAKEKAESGSLDMEAMVSAMNEIQESSQNITKIIKTIDDIAFQTNLLALNAAVEAARAGQHGKGFAVVAEEVRNLAARSAKAAAETAHMIESSNTRVMNGSTIASKTSKAFVEIVDRITTITKLVSSISSSSYQQAKGISEISTGIKLIEEVTQTNSASAEETAAAASELSAQAIALKKILDKDYTQEQGIDESDYSDSDGRLLYLPHDE